MPSSDKDLHVCFFELLFITLLTQKPLFVMNFCDVIPFSILLNILQKMWLIKRLSIYRHTCSIFNYFMMILNIMFFHVSESSKLIDTMPEDELRKLYVFLFLFCSTLVSIIICITIVLTYFTCFKTHLIDFLRSCNHILNIIYAHVILPISDMNPLRGNTFWSWYP